VNKRAKDQSASGVRYILIFSAVQCRFLRSVHIHGYAKSLLKEESRLYIFLLKQSEGFDKGFRQLYEDLGRVVSLPDLPIDTTITIFKLLLVVVISGKGKRNVMLTICSLVDTPANLCFRIALQRLRENRNNNNEASKNMCCSSSQHCLTLRKVSCSELFLLRQYHGCSKHSGAKTI
jgi:hypothetical protein